MGTLLESELDDLENLAPSTEEQELLARFMSTMGAADNPMLAGSLPGSRVNSARNPKKKPHRLPVNMWQVRVCSLALDSQHTSSHPIRMEVSVSAWTNESAAFTSGGPPVHDSGPLSPWSREISTKGRR